MGDSTNKPEEKQDWHELWEKNISQIDDKLVEFFKGAGEKAGDLTDQAKSKIKDMLDKTDMDEKARANWDKAKADGKLLGAKIENRIQHLIADGKIAWAGLIKKNRQE